MGNPPAYESTITYTYDAGNRLTQIVDSISGTITRAYDVLDRLTSETTPQGSVSYTYDAAGRRTSMTVSGQPTVFYTYDDANRLTQITQGTSTVSFAYDLAGRRTSLTLPNGILVEYAYDAASRVTAITYKLGTTVLGDLTYTYDAAGNRTKIGGSFARTGIPQAIASANYNAANQQLALADKTMTYDNNGNLTSLTDANGTVNYTWNARNQLTGISGPGVSASFEYDLLGRRVNKTINGNVIEFLYDGVNPVQETDGVNVLANMLRGLGIDEIFFRTDAAGANSFLTDALGSTVALSDSGGSAQTEYTYEPFGGTTVSGISSTNSFQYTGRENDGTDLYYYRARYYHPGLQRFISEDPIEFAGGDFNLYAYVKNRPASLVDPLGTCPFCVALPVAGPATVALGNAAAAVTAFLTGIVIGDIISDTFESRGKQNVRDTGLEGLSDEEVRRRARDKSLSGEERRRYQREEKARGERRSRQSKDKPTPPKTRGVIPPVPNNGSPDSDDPSDCLGARKC